MRLSFALVLGLATWGVSSVVAEEFVSVKGQFVFDGELHEAKKIAVGGKMIADESLVVDAKTRGIANILVLVYIKPGEKALPSPAPVNPFATIEIHADGFRPRLTVLSTKQILLVQNVDEAKHIFKADLLGSTPITQPLAPMEQLTQRLTSEEKLPAQLSDALHPALKGHLIVTNQSASVSDQNGKFELSVPKLDKVTLRVWHERSKFIARVNREDVDLRWDKGRFTVDTTSGDLDLGVIKVAADEFPDK